MKKIVVSLLTLIVAIVLSSTASFATTGKVNTDTARVRSEASSDAKIVDLLSLDDEVEILDETGDWYKVKTQSQTGYVSKNLLDVNGSTKTDSSEKNENSTNAENTAANEENTNSTSANTSQNESTNTATATDAEDATSDSQTQTKIAESYVGNLKSDVSIKILPSINSMDIAKIEKGTQITVVEVINDWCHVESTSYSGWVRVNSVENAVTNEDTATNADQAEEVQEEQAPAEEENTVRDEEVTSRASDTARQILEAQEAENAANSQAQAAPQNTNTSTNVSSANGTNVVNYAKQYLGSRYVSGGSSPSTGFDCSGFTSYVYKNFGVSLSRSTSGQASNGTSVNRANLQPGDLLIFRNGSNSSIGHVGIYIGGNQFIHAANKNKGVITTSLSDGYYNSRYVDARRVVQ